MLAKYAVRFTLNGKSRTYILMDLGSTDAICTALDMLEADVPDISLVRGLSVVSKPWPEGAYLVCEENGPVIDMTHPTLRLVEPEPERAAA